MGRLLPHDQYYISRSENTAQEIANRQTIVCSVAVEVICDDGSHNLLRINRHSTCWRNPLKNGEWGKCCFSTRGKALCRNMTLAKEPSW